MTNEIERIMKICENLDENIYPETIDVIEMNVGDDDGKLVLWSDAYELAEMLIDADKTQVMPKGIADYVIGILLEEIENGNASAMNELGALYYTGRCGEQNFKKAVEYYKMASDNGNRQATENLGYCYYYGRSVPVDYEKAYHYFIKGALDRHLISLYKIGDMYKNGYYVEKDEKEAFIIYSTCYDEMDEFWAADIGADICMRLGNAYYYGMGTKINYNMALSFYQEAERYYYKKIQNGDYFAKKGLAGVLEKLNDIREKLVADLPDFEWNKTYTTE